MVPIKELALYGKALKHMPSSHNQKNIIKKLNELRVARGAKPLKV